MTTIKSKMSLPRPTVLPHLWVRRLSSKPQEWKICNEIRQASSPLMVSEPRGDADLFPNLLWSICQLHHTPMSFPCPERAFHGAGCLPPARPAPQPLLQPLGFAWAQAGWTFTHMCAHARARTHTHIHTHTEPGSFIKCMLCPFCIDRRKRKTRTSL